MAGDHEAAAAAGRQEDWLAILEAQGVQFLVLDAQRDRDLVQLFQSQGSWAVDFQEEESVLLVRSQAASGAPLRAQMEGAGR
jgi:hypothetical protein